jgi:hypothetical protein
MVIDFAKLERKRARDRAYQAKRRAAKKAQKLGVPTSAPLLTNHVALLIDSSGSMGSLRAEVVEQINKQIANTKAAAYANKQKTLVSVYTFSGRGSLCTLARNLHPEAVQMFSVYNYNPDGQTALCDSILQVINNLRVEDDGAKTTSFLMVVVTDGQENDSYASPQTAADAIFKAQSTDRWTFAMLMPPGGRAWARKLGVPDGNIQEWEATKAGLDRAGVVLTASASNYYTARSGGMTATTKFFTDLSSVRQKDLNKLADLTGQFKRWQVKSEIAISDFVQNEHGRAYEVGKAFYQLTKPEKVQAYKGIVIEDRATKKLYGGDEARQLIGLPTTPGSVVKVNPGNHANFNLFVQSTSMNRKLVRGTTLLYRV